VGARLDNPSAAHRAQLGALGIDPDGPDDKSGTGGLNARSRWGRGFVRALYYQHRNWSGAPGGGNWRATRRVVPRRGASLVVEVGRRLPGSRQAGVLLPGRAVRVMVTTGGREHVRRSTAPSFTLDGAGQSIAEDRGWDANT